MERGKETFSGEMGNGVISFDPGSEAVYFVQTVAAGTVARGSVQRLRDGVPAGPAVGVMVFVGGRLKAQHTIDELTVRPWLVSIVPFWVQWITGLKREGHRVLIHTTSLRRVEIDRAVRDSGIVPRALELRESSCASCGEACGCEGGIDCRVWLHQGKEHTVAPVLMIMDAILAAVYSTEEEMPMPSRSNAMMNPAPSSARLSIGSSVWSKAGSFVLLRKSAMMTFTVSCFVGGMN